MAWLPFKKIVHLKMGDFAKYILLKCVIPNNEYAAKLKCVSTHYANILSIVIRCSMASARLEHERTS